MDLISAKIVELIEDYITEDNLKSDYTLANCVEKNNGWIRLELLSRCKKLSNYNYDTILHALSSKQSKRIELSSFEPRCIRRRCQPFTEDRIQDTQTVVVTGLPFDTQYEELMIFFNQFYPVKEIIKISSFSTRFNGNIHLRFHQSQDALALVEQSKLRPFVYRNKDSSNGYTIVCHMFNEERTKLNDQHSFLKGKSFSTRLTNHSFNDNSIPQKSSPIFGFKSNTCVTDQILFCQNIPNNTKLIKNIEYDKEIIVSNRYSYDFYTPNHLLKQTQECIIISALNPFCFTIQLRQDAREFDKFQREINEFYNTIDDQRYHIRPKELQLNLCVISLDPKSSDEKKIWNRSQILDYDPTDNTVNLFYVDLGTWDEYVPIHRLRHLTDRFHQLSVFSITCRLAHILPLNHENDPLTWTDDATNQFLSVINQNQMEIEFLSFACNGCFQTNLFVMNSSQYVCVNDYMIHIKQAKAIDNLITVDDDGQNSIQSDEHDINSNGSPIHAVVALYNRLGEVLQQSSIESRTTSMSSSSLSSPGTSPRLCVKLIHVNIPTNTQYNKQQHSIPIIFVQYQKSIYLPDFNIITLLKLINPHFDSDTIKHDAFNIRYQCVHITQESNFDIFTQLSSLIDLQESISMALYSLEFVDYILKQHNFRVISVFLALGNAKHAQLHAPDLVQWFSMDNEFRFPVPSMTQQPTISYRLPFSNRLIHLI